jgi:hypothetical protein
MLHSVTSAGGDTGAKRDNSPNMLGVCRGLFSLGEHVHTNARSVRSISPRNPVIGAVAASVFFVFVTAVSGPSWKVSLRIIASMASTFAAACCDARIVLS